MQSLSTPRRACSTVSRTAPQPAVNLRSSAVRNPTISRRQSQLRVISVDTDIFPAEVLQSDQIVLVDFWASWCGPCKLVAPLMTWAEKEYSGQIKVVKVEHDKNPELIAKYKVYGLPTLLLFKNGEEMQGSKREGAVNKVMLTEYLKSNGAIA